MRHYDEFGAKFLAIAKLSLFIIACYGLAEIRTGMAMNCLKKRLCISKSILVCVLSISLQPALAEQYIYLSCENGPHLRLSDSEHELDGYSHDEGKYVAMCSPCSVWGDEIRNSLVIPSHDADEAYLTVDLTLNRITGELNVLRLRHDPLKDTVEVFYKTDVYCSKSAFLPDQERKF